MVRKRIVMPRGLVKGLAEEFHADPVTIYRYLRFEMPEKYVAESVRKRALELGGRIVEERDVTEVDIIKLKEQEGGEHGKGKA